MALFAKSKKEYKSEEELKKEGDLQNQVSRNLVVHKMPKGYKSNGFNYQGYFGDEAKRNPDQPKAKLAAAPLAPHRRTGLVIIVIGIILVGGLGYVGWRFFNGSGTFNLSNLFSGNKNVATNQTPNNLNQVPATTTPIISTTTPPVSTSTATSSEVVVPPVVSTQITDTDADGLSDEEERAIGTDITNPDTDGDGYNDLTEVAGLYNPNGKGQIADNPGLKRYINNVKGYGLYQPKNWTVSVADQSNTVIFNALDNSFIQIVVQPNAKKQSIKGWALAELNLDSSNIITAAWGEGIKNGDGSIYYFTDSKKNQIYVFSYVPAEGQPAYYQNIFDMMVKSFYLTK
ncbi:MAG TPA: thrombospondin type 3 repeat-containing protein [bacterium]|nr:thrombospondin type 3 repeat-containing protein [bacterium]HPT29344.1 thrombospondin type 3 repeat-containing protein [bacterium]